MSKRRLCDLCQEILWLPPCEEAEKEHHKSIGSLMHSVGQGCFVCISVERASTNVIFHHTTYQWVAKKHENSGSMPGPWKLDINIQYNPDGDCSMSFLFQILDPKTEGPSLDMSRVRLHPSMREKGTFDLAQEWISKCRSQHIECQAGTAYRKLPTRLVQVTSTPRTHDLKANICRSDTLSIETQYLTLSHCWGKQKFLTSNRSNISFFEESLPIQSLSKTFQDALFATTRLGFQYIWIDSLCIVQDDQDDWKRESSVMHNVYKNAVCNILAPGFHDGDDGFVLNQRRLDPTPLPLGPISECSRRDLHGHKYDRDATSLLVLEKPWKELDRGPVYQRAWVLQEQLLAPRALHFGEDQVFWECKHTLANEVWPNGWLNTCFELDFLRNANINVQHFRVSTEQGNEAHLYRKWALVVRDFTNRHLTFASDCLPALAGIANEFAILFGDSYIYGLWNGDLHRGVLFQQIGKGISRSEPTGQESPSWSWVSLHERIIWAISLYDNKNSHLCEITVDHHKKMPHLHLRGKPMLRPDGYKSLSIDRVSGYDRLDGPDAGSFELFFYPDAWFTTAFSNCSSKQSGDKPSFTQEDIHDGSDFFQLDLFLESIVIMPILYFMSPSTRDLPRRISMKSLLLSAHPGAQNGVYRRVGIMDARKESSDKMDFEAIKAQLWVDQKPLSSNFFRERHDDGTYTITVV